jgi:tetratricopeptide (TPR) repeat protein
VVSEHFVLHTDLDLNSAKEASSDLEAMFATLSDLAFPSHDRPKMAVEVVMFKNDEEFETIVDNKVSDGAFVTGGLHDFERGSIAILKADLRNTRNVFQHELTHFMVSYYYPQAPAWLSEGLAEYYGATEIGDEDVRLGVAPDILRNWAALLNMRRMGYYVSVQKAPRVGDLMAMTPLEFYGDLGANTDSDLGRASLASTMVRYASAWTLVHLLQTDPKYKSDFGAYLASLREGERSERSWAMSIGGFNSDTLDADFRAHLAAPELTAYRVKYKAPRPQPLRVDPLTDNELHLLWARLRPWEEGAKADAARAELEKVETRDPGNMNLGLLKAWWALEKDDVPGAERALSAIAPEYRGDARVLNATGWVKLLPLLEHKSAKPADFALALHPTATKLAPVARSAAQFDLLARYQAGRGNLDEAIAYEKRAVDVDPNCVPCLSAAADMLSEKGLIGEALKVATFAYGLVAEGKRPTKLLGQIQGLQKRLAAASAVPSAPAPVSSAAPAVSSSPSRTKAPRARPTSTAR